MPVRKMRDITEAVSQPAPPLRAENLRSAFELSEACLRLNPHDPRRGVRRYRSIGEAQLEAPPELPNA